MEIKKESERESEKGRMAFVQSDKVISEFFNDGFDQILVEALDMYEERIKNGQFRTALKVLREQNGIEEEILVDDIMRVLEEN